MSVIRRWSDDEGTEAVIYEGRISITAKPSMVADDGTVIVGIDLPADLLGAVEALAKIERVYERTMPGPKDALRDQVLEIIARHRAGGR